MALRARSLAALGAYVCLAAQLVGILHLLLVRHATCPNHGELTHGAAPAAVGRRSLTLDVIVSAPPAAGVEDVDDHCLAPITRRAAAALGVSTAATRAPDPGGPLLGMALPPAASAPLPLLGVAPKTSPPSA